MEDVFKIIGVVVGVVVLAAVIGLFLAFPTMWCWNYVMAGTFSFPTLTWSKAWCLTWIMQIFFKSTNYNVKS